MVDKKELKGIKGWLKTYLIYNIILFVIGLWGVLLEFYKYFIMELIHSESMYEITSYLLLELLMFVLIIMICFKKRLTPMLAISSESIGVVIGIIDFVLSRMRIDNYLELILSIGLGITWILYFVRSQRVKNTFVR